MAKFCAYCGKPMADADVFCANCGKRVSAPPAPQPAQPAQPAQPTPPAAPQQPPQGAWQTPQPQWPQQPPQPPQPAPQWQQAAPPQPPRSGGAHAKPGKRSAGLLIGIIAGAVVIVAVLLGGFVWPGFFKSKGGGPETPENPTVEETEAPEATETPAPRETEKPDPTEPPSDPPAGTPAPSASSYKNPFTDVAASDWFYDSVMWAGEQGIVSGAEFKPSDLTNRGQALTFLWRSAGKPAPTLTASPYSDVKQGDYYYEPVLWGYESGVIANSGDGMFHADGALTRAQAITFLCRAASGSDTIGKRSFSDVREDNWYFASANWALANGVVGRDSSWAFKPDQQMTRAMFVTFLYRTFAEGARKADGAEPAPEGLRDVGINIDVDSPAPQAFRSITKNGNPLSFTAAVTDYRVFEENDAMPKREGFEWRVMTLETVADGLDGSGLRLSLMMADAYNVRLHDASRKTEDGGMETFTAFYDGRLVDYTVWWTKNSDDGKGASTWTFTASVPVGYDGVVVGFKNADVASSNRSLADFYTGEDDFALFRMK